MSKKLPSKNYFLVRKKLIKIKKKAGKKLLAKHQKAARWLGEKQLSVPSFQDSKRLLASASLFGTILLTSGNQTPKLLPAKTFDQQLETGLISANKFNLALSRSLLPILQKKNIGVFSDLVNSQIYFAVKEVLGLKATFELNGIKLNHAYGWMGYEQHLKRFPGDSLNEHNEEQKAGIAPGLGAWGYFAPSRQAMNNEIVLREKYYIAVQTLYLPDWLTDTKKLYDWFKYKKVIVINPGNGRAVVGVVGDAGPAFWTGKQFGGSPELMKALNSGKKMSKIKVLVLFLDDKGNKVPLGPINFNFIKGKLEEI